ncbi:MAG: hypothetical protein IJI42_02580 [Methanobrevibacter sp.]|nr:hypothetical protein [Methanobrevibacter sp.]
MANVASGKLEGIGEYINVETALSLDLKKNTTYSVQIQGEAIICEAESLPSENEGFYWNQFKPFGYKKESAYLWVKIKSGTSIFINFSE